ncbi:MAG: hypothetical protein ACFFEF_08325 [Candidatus Thorarchaeota archaeon]
MSLADLILLLKQDLAQTFRVRSVKGRRSEKKNPLRRLILPIGAVAVGLVIVWAIVALGEGLWPVVDDVVRNNLGLGATIFNFLMIFSFLGSIMMSATTVANSSRMEYLMTMPISLKTLFAEKMLIVILYNSAIWLIIGTPIFIGFSIISPYWLSFLSVPVFIGCMLALVSFGVSLGGLIGLAASRLVAGRRMLKQIGYGLMSAIGIIGGTLWYVSIYTDSSGALFDSLFQIAALLGLSSDITPGYSMSVISLGLLVGTSFKFVEIAVPIFYAILSIGLILLNATLSEEAHYSGWLASDSKRSSKNEISIGKRRWDPQPFRKIKFNQTVSVSLWYNLASVRRESRVFTQYLLGPIRFVIFIILPGFIITDTGFDFAGYLVLAALIPFATSYGLYFAGYETVYEGKNIMNLQLAATNMQDYIKGKAYSAVPFTVIAGAIVSFAMAFIAPSIAFYLPAVVICLGFLTLASGAISANAAAIGGDFKAERIITRQRGSAVQMPIRGWSILRAQIIPMMLGFGGVFGIILAGVFLNPFYAYIAVPVFVILCFALFNHYTRSAGIKLAQLEASKYL